MTPFTVEVMLRFWREANIARFAENLSTPNVVADLSVKPCALVLAMLQCFSYWRAREHRRRKIDAPVVTVCAPSACHHDAATPDQLPIRPLMPEHALCPQGCGDSPR